jgi:shikimate dehydrogenase
LLGHPVSHSISPLFQNAALEAAGLPVRYEAIDVVPAMLGRVLAQIRAEGSAGNVTVPHKQPVAEACDSLTPIAARAGAVNTFWMDGDRLMGDNTDAGGFAAAARRLIGETPTDLTIGLLGAGGAAAAVLATIETWTRCQVLVYNRTPERAEKLVSRFRSVAQRIGDVKQIGRAHLVINATSVGLNDSAFPMDPGLLRQDAAVLDLCYRAGETAWVRAARAKGHRALDGLTMLIEQGALAFERWFGKAPDREAMWNAVS